MTSAYTTIAKRKKSGTFSVDKIIYKAITCLPVVWKPSFKHIKRTEAYCSCQNIVFSSK